MFSSVSMREAVIRRVSNGSRQCSSPDLIASEPVLDSNSRPATPSKSPKPSPRMSQSSPSAHLRKVLIRTYSDSGNKLMDFYAGGPAPPIRYATSGTSAPRAWRKAKRLQDQIEASDILRRSNSVEPPSPTRLDDRHIGSEPEGSSEEGSYILELRAQQRNRRAKLPGAYKLPTPRVFKPLLPPHDLQAPDERKSPLELLSSDSEDESLPPYRDLSPCAPGVCVLYSPSRRAYTTPVNVVHSRVN